jgi:dihydrofolate reductase
MYARPMVDAAKRISGDNMSKIVHSIFVSLDGVIDAPEEWQGPFWNDEMEEYSFELLRAADALLLGRVTYEIFAKEWPANTDDAGFADRMNSLPKFVASTTLDEVTWNSTLLSGNIVDELSRLKQQPGKDLLIYGSSGLAQTLLQHDLIDELLIWLHPVVVGGGKRFFKEGPGPKNLRLAATKTYDTGVVILSYRP